MSKRTKDNEDKAEETSPTDDYPLKRGLPFSSLLTPFTNIVDELVEFSEYDPELAEGLKWIDREAQKRGISFYEMVYHVLERYDVDAKAGDWVNKLRTKSD